MRTLSRTSTGPRTTLIKGSTDGNGHYQVFVRIEGKSRQETVNAVGAELSNLIAVAPALLELARAIILEAGLIEAAHNQPKHPRAWQNSGERWAALARAAITEGR